MPDATARVVLTGSLGKFTGGETELELEPIAPDSEVHVLPWSAGGLVERLR